MIEVYAVISRLTGIGFYGEDQWWRIIPTFDSEQRIIHIYCVCIIEFVSHSQPNLLHALNMVWLAKKEATKVIFKWIKSFIASSLRQDAFELDILFGESTQKSFAKVFDCQEGRQYASKQSSEFTFVTLPYFLPRGMWKPDGHKTMWSHPWKTLYVNRLVSLGLIEVYGCPMDIVFALGQGIDVMYYLSCVYFWWMNDAFWNETAFAKSKMVNSTQTLVKS